MKKILRLTESELKNIVENSVIRANMEKLMTEGVLTEGNKMAIAKSLAKLLGVSVAAALAAIGALAAGAFDEQGEAMDNAGSDPNASKYQQYLDNTPDTLTQGDIATGKFDYQESRIRRAVMESLTKLMNETTDDRLTKAMAASDYKVKDTENKYGRNSYPAANARRQNSAFKSEYGKRIDDTNGKIERVARLEKLKADNRSAAEAERKKTHPEEFEEKPQQKKPWYKKFNKK